MVRVVSRGQRNRDICHPHEMLLLDQSERLAVRFGGEDSGNIVAELRGCDSKLAIEDFLIFVDCVNLDSFLHERSAAVEDFGV